MSSLTRAVEIRRGSGPPAVPLAAGALTAFAANSLLCRAALGSGAIDPVSFTTARLGAGALVLALLVRTQPRRVAFVERESPFGVLALFVYALGFSLAYVHIPAATGALILFGMVQLTMMGAGLAAGERPAPRQWVGIGLAAFGLWLLLLPGAGAPSLLGAALMGTAGVAWGAYSLLGRRARDPLGVVERSFLGALPLAAAASLVVVPWAELSVRGLVLAAASGAFASGAGYALWYAVLPRLSATRAAAVQLFVPVLAAAGGVVFLAEPLSLRLVASGAVTLGGIGLVVASRR